MCKSRSILEVRPHLLDKPWSTYPFLRENSERASSSLLRRRKFLYNSPTYICSKNVCICWTWTAMHLGHTCDGRHSVNYWIDLDLLKWLGCSVLWTMPLQVRYPWETTTTAIMFTLDRTLNIGDTVYNLLTPSFNYTFEPLESVCSFYSPIQCVQFRVLSVAIRE